MAFKLLDYIFGPAAHAESMQGQMTNPVVSIGAEPVDPMADQVRSDGFTPAYRGADDLDNFGEETSYMRGEYLKAYSTEPVFSAAIDGKAESIACQDVMILPADKSKPADCDAADFLDWTVANTDHGWDGLILNMLKPAFLLGWSAQEIVVKSIGADENVHYAGWIGLKYCKPKNTEHLRLSLDAHRNVLGVVNTVRGLATYPRRKFVLFHNRELFDNPFGTSDGRGSFRSFQLIDSAYRLWHYAIKAYGGPFLKGKWSQKDRRQALEKAMEQGRAGGWITCHKDDEIEVINLASATSFDAFEKQVRIHREEILMGIRGAYLPYMQGNAGAGETRGDAGVSGKSGSNPKEYLLSLAVVRRINRDLVPSLILPNFPAGTGMPRVVIGGVDWEETKVQLGVAKDLQGLGHEVDPDYLYKITSMPPPSVRDAGKMPPPGPDGAPPEEDAGSDGPPAGAPPDAPPALPPAAPKGSPNGDLGPDKADEFLSQKFSEEADESRFFVEFNESLHPRDKNGQWITKTELDEAGQAFDAGDGGAKFQELKAKTRPEDVEKLRAAFQGKTNLGHAPGEDKAVKRVPPAASHDLLSDDPDPAFNVHKFGSSGKNAPRADEFHPDEIAAAKADPAKAAHLRYHVHFEDRDRLESILSQGVKRSGFDPEDGGIGGGNHVQIQKGDMPGPLWDKYGPYVAGLGRKSDLYHDHRYNSVVHGDDLPEGLADHLEKHGAAVGTLDDDEQRQKLFHYAKMPKQIATSEVPAAAKNYGEAAGGEVPEDWDASNNHVYKRISPEWYLRRKGDAEETESGDTYDFVHKKDVPELSNLPDEFWGKLDEETEDGLDSPDERERRATNREKAGQGVTKQDIESHKAEAKGYLKALGKTDKEWDAHHAAVDSYDTRTAALDEELNEHYGEMGWDTDADPENELSDAVTAHGDHFGAGREAIADHERPDDWTDDADFDHESVLTGRHDDRDQHAAELADLVDKSNDHRLTRAGYVASHKADFAAHAAEHGAILARIKSAAEAVVAKRGADPEGEHAENAEHAKAILAAIAKHSPKLAKLANPPAPKPKPNSTFSETVDPDPASPWGTPAEFAAMLDGMLAG